MKRAASILEMKRAVAAADGGALRAFHIVVLRNIEADQLALYWKYYGLHLGLDVQVRFDEYDGAVQTALATAAPILDGPTDCVVVLQTLEGLSPHLARGYNGMHADARQLEIDRIGRTTKLIVDGLRRQTTAMILWHGFEPPLAPADGIHDSSTLDGQLGCIRRLNDDCRAMLADVPGAYFVDMEMVRARVGGSRFYDPRYWYMGRAPYAAEGLDEIAFESLKYVRPLVGASRKCLVLDCDNTLWGGVVGEDGIGGIKLSQDYPGVAFRDFQQEALNLYHRGVLLAICSKNNEADVWEVFDRHPAMLLKREHIAHAEINWSDKAANLRRIAATLNIGLDSLVMADDSEFEINLVRRELPEVDRLLMPSSSPSRYAEILATCGLFELLSISAEGRKRGEMYRAETARRELEQATDLPGYYASLEMQLDIELVSDVTIGRVAEQTQKTNQFNLTTRRYSEADIAAFAERSDAEVITIALKDCFGDFGIVGSAIVVHGGPVARLDTMLLSCRALGRRVEAAFLVAIARLARARGASELAATYLPTAKNGQVLEFLPAHGFELKVEDPDTGVRDFTLDLTGSDRDFPDIFHRINCPIEQGVGG